MRGRWLEWQQARAPRSLCPRPSALDKRGEWTQALEILERARRTSSSIPIENYQETLLWKHAYLHRQFDRVMPILAQMPFRADESIRAEISAWILQAYQIRGGVPRVEVPAIEGQENWGYIDAVAMQIAALEGDPGAADRIEALRAATAPVQQIEMVHADRGMMMTFDPMDTALWKARTAMVARSKDYVRAAALARVASGSIFVDLPNMMIASFLEEGDWQGAAAIARENDPRSLSVPEGFDDTRTLDYLVLNEHLAVVAAWSGDDGASAEFMNKAKEAWQTVLAQWPGEYDDDRLHWSDTLLAGVAEGRLPRKCLHVLLSPFLEPY
jgi:hypothetical protein